MSKEVGAGGRFDIFLDSGFRYEMIGETQPEIEFLEVVASVYPFKSRQFNPICNQNLILLIAGCYLQF